MDELTYSDSGDWPVGADGSGYSMPPGIAVTGTLSAEVGRALAELPSLDTLRARIVGMISTPATRVAGVLQGSAGQLARVFGAFARKSEEGEAAAAA